MNFDLLVGVMSVPIGWMLDNRYRVVYGYRNPSSAEIRRIGSLTPAERISMRYHEPLRWLGVAAFSLTIVLAAYFRDITEITAWLFVAIMFVTALAASQLSTWWFIKHRFKKPRK